jgi:hypothetical protein
MHSKTPLLDPKVPIPRLILEGASRTNASSISSCPKGKKPLPRSIHSALLRYVPAAPSIDVGKFLLILSTVKNITLAATEAWLVRLGPVEFEEPIKQLRHCAY